MGTSQSIVSRLETGESIPDATLALRLQVIFGHSPRALFPGLFVAVEDAVMANAGTFDRTLGDRQDYATQTKRRLLTAMAHRAGGNRRST